ncbi:MAG: RNA pseudouridine synthase, partial [Thiotrichaceae bacterium]|nr:RNA pseudouridine synthase [Thiotrichaceae bacterium]
IEKFELHLDVTQDNITAIDLIADNSSFSRQKIKQIMKNGSVWLTLHAPKTEQTSDKKNSSTQRIRRAKKQLLNGQILHCYYNEAIFNQQPLQPTLIADEQDYSIWFKPAGMLSQGSKYGDHCALYRWVETNLKPQRNAFIVHRLDKATSGLIMIAHSKTAAAALSQLFAHGAVDKYYKAIIHGCLPCDFTLPMILDERLENKAARTKILSSRKLTKTLTQTTGQVSLEASLLDIQILTGRKHQIRQHLANIGHPIIGDRLYGSGEVDAYDLCLTAYKTAFISPFDTKNKHYELDSSYYPKLELKVENENN